MIKVRCVISNLDEVTAPAVKQRLQKWFGTQGRINTLTKGKEYVVFALSMWADGGLRVYIENDGGSWYPSPYPAELFDFVETAIPPCWSLSLKNGALGVEIAWLAFPNWGSDKLFYERLTDCDESAVLEYQRQRLELLGPPSDDTPE